MATKTFTKGDHCFQSVRQYFVRHFQGRYQIVASAFSDREFVVKKDAFSGVYVAIREDAQTNTITIAWRKNAPHFLLRGPWARLLGDVQVVKDVDALIERIKSGD